MEKIEKLAKTTAAFDKNSEEYDSWYRSLKGKTIFKSELLAVKAILPRGKGVEIGVGTGVFASELGVGLGVDTSMGCLKIAQKRGINVVCGAGEALPFKDRSFDFMLYTVTLCFLADPKAALNESSRVLKPSGKLVICFIPRDSPWGEFYLEKKAAGNKFYKHANFYTLKEVCSMLRKAGFISEARRCTLAQQPDVITRIEKPSRKKCELAGFYCVRARKV